MPILNRGDKVKIHGTKYEVCGGKNYYYLYNIKGRNDQAFRDLGILEKKYTLVRGMTDDERATREDFPYCKSLEQLTEVVEALRNFTGVSTI